MMPPKPFRLRYAAHLGFRSLDLPLFPHSATSRDPVDQIRYAAALGFAGIQDPWFATRPTDDQGRIVAAIREHGLAAASIVCGSPQDIRRPLWQPRDTADRAALKTAIETTFIAAARLGARQVAVVTGRHDDMTDAAQETLFAVTVQDAGEQARAHGITLMLEAISPRNVPGLLLTRFAQAAQLVRRIDRPAVRLIYDTGHLQATEGDLLGNFERHRDIIGLVQIANHPGRTEPSVGEINMAAILRAVKASGYQGLIELEHLWAEPGAAAERAGIDWLRMTDAAL